MCQAAAGDMVPIDSVATSARNAATQHRPLSLMSRMAVDMWVSFLVWVGGVATRYATTVP